MVALVVPLKPILPRLRVHHARNKLSRAAQRSSIAKIKIMYRGGYSRVCERLNSAELFHCGVIIQSNILLLLRTTFGLYIVAGSELSFGQFCNELYTMCWITIVKATCFERSSRFLRTWFFLARKLSSSRRRVDMKAEVWCTTESENLVHRNVLLRDVSLKIIKNIILSWHELVWKQLLT